MCVTTISFKKGPWIWKRARRGTWEGLGGGKGKGERYNYIVISKRKERELKDIPEQQSSFANLTCVCMSACMGVYMCVWVYMGVYVCVWVHVWMHIWVHVWVHVWHVYNCVWERSAFRSLTSCFPIGLRDWTQVVGLLQQMISTQSPFANLRTFLLNTEM